jgi:hypothetical protein
MAGDGCRWSGEKQQRWVGMVAYIAPDISSYLNLTVCLGLSLVPMSSRIHWNSPYVWTLFGLSSPNVILNSLKLTLCLALSSTLKSQCHPKFRETHLVFFLRLTLKSQIPMASEMDWNSPCFSALVWLANPKVIPHLLKLALSLGPSLTLKF